VFLKSKCPKSVVAGKGVGGAPQAGEFKPPKSNTEMHTDFKNTSPSVLISGPIPWVAESGGCPASAEILKPTDQGRMHTDPKLRSQSCVDRRLSVGLRKAWVSRSRRILNQRFKGGMPQIQNKEVICV